MTPPEQHRILVALTLFLLFAGPATAAAPAISSISPNSVSMCSPAFTLTVNGSGFDRDSVAYWNDTPLETTFISSAQLTAQIPAQLVDHYSISPITVRSSGQLSNAVGLAAICYVAASFINPYEVTIGSPDTTITITGVNFSPRLTAIFTSADYSETASLITHYISSTTISVVVPSRFLAVAGAGTLELWDPCGSCGAILKFGIKPEIKSLSPTSVAMKSTDFTLTVNGRGFDSESVIYWDLKPVTTRYVSPTQLTAVIPTSGVDDRHNSYVSVMTGGVQSSQVIVPVTYDFRITSISPPECRRRDWSADPHRRRHGVHSDLVCRMGPPGAAIHVRTCSGNVHQLQSRHRITFSRSTHHAR
jgi:hypothetical protein